MDRPVCGGDRPEASARAHAGLPSAPRLRPSAIRAVRLRHGSPDCASSTRPARVILDAAAAAGARVWVVSEYGHADVSHPILLNRALREAGLLKVRPGPFGEVLDTFGSEAFAVCDHQVAHIYLDHPDDPLSGRVRELLSGVARCERDCTRVAKGLRSASIILAPVIWWPFRGEIPGLPIRTGWTIAWPPISREPSTFTANPAMTHASYSSTRVESGRRAERSSSSSRKSLGFRTLFDVVPLDPDAGAWQPRLAGGRISRTSRCLLGDGPAPGESAAIPMTETRNLLWRALVPD